MNIKSLISTAVAVLAALILYDLVVKKVIIKTSYEEELEEVE